MNQKCLFFTQQHLIKNDGASEKVIAQRDAIVHLGIETRFAYMDCSLEGWQLHVDDAVIAVNANYKSLYDHLFEYVKKEKIGFMYIRYGVNAGYQYNRMLKRVANEGVIVFLEIPTFPYDGEFSFSSFKTVARQIMERYYRNKWKGIVHRIVTFSVDKEIYGVPTVILHNASARALPIRKEMSNTGDLSMIAVANLAFWHGYDRLIKGMSDYYSNNPAKKVYLTIAGRGDEEVYNGLVSLTKELGLVEYVNFVGSKSSYELDEYFNRSNLAVGCLACHRKKVYEVKSLKNVEYAMRGIPMVYSENNTDFDDQPYVYKVPADDTNIDINALIEFVHNFNLEPVTIHETVKDFTWDVQMKELFKDYCDAIS